MKIFGALILASFISFNAFSETEGMYKKLPCNLELYVPSNMPKDIEEKITKALSFLENIKGKDGTNLHYEIFGGEVNGETYCKFLQRGVNSISYDKVTEDDVQTGSVAYNVFGFIKIQDPVRDYSYAQVASIIIHEAAHSTLEFHEHVKCSKTFKHKNLRGVEACEDRVISAYGSQYTLSKNLKKYCFNCTEKEMNDLDTMGKEALERIVGWWRRLRLTKD